MSMTIKKMMEAEVRALVSNSELKNKKPVQMMIGIKFSDGHIHLVLPDKAAQKEILDALIEKTGHNKAGSWTEGL
jgi:hypothetical protein